MDLQDWITVRIGNNRLIAASIVVACIESCTLAETQNVSRCTGKLLGANTPVESFHSERPRTNTDFPHEL